MPGRFGSGGMPPLPLATGRWLLLGRRHENRGRGFGERLQNRARQNMWNKGNSGRPTGWPSMRCILHPRSASSDVNQPSGRTRRFFQPCSRPRAANARRDSSPRTPLIRRLRDWNRRPFSARLLDQSPPHQDLEYSSKDAHSPLFQCPGRPTPPHIAGALWAGSPLTNHPFRMPPECERNRRVHSEWRRRAAVQAYRGSPSTRPT